MELTKRHYRIIANTLYHTFSRDKRTLKEKKLYADIVEELAVVFESENPRFNFTKFWDKAFKGD